MLEPQISISADRFLNLIRSSKQGKLKIYIGMAAGVGKTFRMLLEAKELLEEKVDVMIGYIETHGRKETTRLLEGIPSIERKKIFYKGKMLEEMDVDAVLIQKPEVVLVDELAHTNVPGSKNEKRWQDVKELIEAGINVISTVNIQHIESINEQVEKITGIKITERVPDSIIHSADEVVNVDLTIEELIDRLEEGKIYDLKKVPVALQNFFQKDKLLRLRDLALKEVSRQIERKIIREIPLESRERINAIVTALSSNFEAGKKIIRRSSRLAALYNSKWYVIYVQTDKEKSDKIDPAVQRHLLNNFKLAAELGAEVEEVKSNEVAGSIIEFAKRKEASLVVIGKPSFTIFYRLKPKNLFRVLAAKAAQENIDIYLVSQE
ncbi:MAG TPA: sensor histidine kinase KdpD [Ignavibacteriaceae bacterium]|nr:sensor histidine kinase KdpD [Ignavibacteriaceae bacterium]